MLLGSSWKRNTNIWLRILLVLKMFLRLHYILITSIHQSILLILTFYDCVMGRVQHHTLNIILCQATTNTILTLNIKSINNNKIICWTMGCTPSDMSSSSNCLHHIIRGHWVVILKMETLRISKCCQYSTYLHSSIASKQSYIQTEWLWRPHNGFSML